MNSGVKGALTASVCFLILVGQSFTLLASGAEPVTSGDFVSSFSDRSYGPNIGNGTYTLHYSYPSVVSRGSNFTARVSLQVNELNGLQEYVEEFQITVLVNVANGQGGSANVGGSSPLYPGTIWGPMNITIPMTQELTGPTSGLLNATVTIDLATTTWVGAPVNQGHYHTASQLVGTLTIAATGGGSSQSLPGGLGYAPYVVVVVGVLLISVGVFLPKIFPEERHRT